MKLKNITFWLLILNIIILPLLGNDHLNRLLHIGWIATLMNYVLPLLLVGFLLYDMFRQKYIPKITISSIIAIIFVFTLMISFIFSIHYEMYTFSNLFKFCVFAFLLVIVPSIEFNEKEKKYLIWSILGLIIFVSIFTISEYLLRFDLIKAGIEKYPGAAGRARATFYIATILDKFLACCIIFVFYLLYHKKIAYWLGLAICCSSIIALACTFSRTGVIILAIMFAILCVYFLFKKRFGLILTILLLSGILYIIPGQNFLFSSTARLALTKIEHISTKVKLPFITNIANVFLDPFIIDISNSPNGSQPNQNYPNDDEYDDQLLDDIDYSANSRAYFQSVARAIMKKNYLTGIGIGSYNYIYDKQNAKDYISDDLKLEQKYLYPHNMYLQLGAEIGIIGMISFFALIVYLNVKSTIEKRNIFPIVIIIGILVMCYSETCFYMKDISYFLILLIGLFANYSFLNEEKIDS